MWRRVMRWKCGDNFARNCRTTAPWVRETKLPWWHGRSNRPHYGPCLSVSFSVLCGLPTRERKGVEKKTKLVLTFLRAGVTGLPIFISDGQSLRSSNVNPPLPQKAKQKSGKYLLTAGGSRVEQLQRSLHTRCSAVGVYDTTRRRTAAYMTAHGVHTSLLYVIHILPNIDQFSKRFRRRNRQEACNKKVIKDSTAVINVLLHYLVKY